MMEVFRGVDVLDQEVEEDLVSDGDVNIGEYPFVVAIFNALKKLQTCTGAIVNERVVLTAEYCVMEFVTPLKIRQS